jgi:uncharacterized protein (DUF1697 family)
MTCIALLRAINLAGRAAVTMSDLRNFFVRLGFTEVRTLLQSGNVVFRSPARSIATIERSLEADAVNRLGIQTDFFVRTAAEWQRIVANNPFREEALSDPGHLLAIVLKRAPAQKDIQALQAAIKGREVVRAGDKHAYIVYPDGVGRSRLTSALIEKKLGTRGTGRNWNTVLKLAALVSEE